MGTITLTKKQLAEKFNISDQMAGTLVDRFCNIFEVTRNKNLNGRVYKYKITKPIIRQMLNYSILLSKSSKRKIDRDKWAKIAISLNKYIIGEEECQIQTQ